MCLSVARLSRDIIDLIPIVPLWCECLSWLSTLRDLLCALLLRDYRVTLRLWFLSDYFSMNFCHGCLHLYICYVTCCRVVITWHYCFCANRTYLVWMPFLDTSAREFQFVRQKLERYDLMPSEGELRRYIADMEMQRNSGTLKWTSVRVNVYAPGSQLYN